MSPARVGVIGAGIAGPVLAVMLKAKGYDSVIFERTDATSEAGIGIALQPNGLRVLAEVPGLLNYIGGFELDEFHFYSVLFEDKGILGIQDFPKKTRDATGIATLGVRRSLLQKRLVEFAEKSGVPVKFGHKLDKLDQTDDSVTVTFDNGVQEIFSFVVGCDGLHSNTRSCLFGAGRADYTGLTQTGGYAPIPEGLRGKSVAMNIFGDGAHMIAVPVDEETMGWMVTQREAEAKETWRAMDAVAVAEFKTLPFSQWDFNASELVRNGTNIIKYGLYDRPELKTWHQGRVFLIGDAAHPTSPHLGQCGNQAFEDAGFLTAVLAKHNPSAESPTLQTLETIFAKVEQVRIPRSAELVKRARAQGETRVVHGVEECIKRNNWYRELCNDEGGLKARFGAQ